MCHILRCALAALLMLVTVESAAAQVVDNNSPGAWARFTQKTKSLFGRTDSSTDAEIANDRGVQRASYQEAPPPATKSASSVAAKPPQTKKKSWFSRATRGPSRTVSQYMAQERP